MRFTVITLFPELFDSFCSASLIGKALSAGRVQLDLVNPRDFASDRHGTCDDAPFGGGEGMVLKPEPVVAAVQSVQSDPDHPRPHRVLLTPQGQRVEQRHFRDLSARGHVVLVCGRYEGFDERIRDFVDQELSLGDFVLNGGEVAAMALIDGTARLVPGVLGNAASLEHESHERGLLEYPQYTRPREFRGQSVPEVLTGGDHERIRKWRRLQQLVRTRERRPDMWAAHALTDEDRQLLATSDRPSPGVYLALLHHPVCDREGQVVTTALTNLDLHDISRSARTYGLSAFFVVTPLESQRALTERILSHWSNGHGARQHAERAEALALAEVATDLGRVQERIQALEGSQPITVATSASPGPERTGFGALSARMRQGDEPVLLVFGTGWGLTGEVLEAADLVLAPVDGCGTYNHLSVRAAAAIVLDRLFGLRD